LFLLLELFLLFFLLSYLLLDFILLVVIEVVEHALNEQAVVVILLILLVLVLISVVHRISFLHHVGTLFLQEVQDAVLRVLRLALAPLWGLVPLRLFFATVVDKVTLADVLSLQFFKSAEVFFAKISPEIAVLW
jgi:hypothetical protein